jgi:hypothetical protein
VPRLQIDIPVTVAVGVASLVLLLSGCGGQRSGSSGNGTGSGAATTTTASRPAPPTPVALHLAAGQVPSSCAPFDVPYFDQELGLSGRDPSYDAYHAHDPDLDGAGNLSCGWPSPGGLYFSVSVTNLPYRMNQNPITCPAADEQGEPVGLHSGIAAVYCHTKAPYLMWKENGVFVILDRGVVAPHQPDDYKAALIDFGNYVTGVLTPGSTASAPAPTTTPPSNKTGKVILSDKLGGHCAAFTLTAARAVIPALPDQQMSLADGNCTYSTQPDGAGDSVSFVNPHVGQPSYAARAQARAAGSGSTTPERVGDGGFCADEGGGNFLLGWQRGSTGLELNARGSTVSCAELARLAQALNASL